MYCGQCDAGAVCGICLVLVPAIECPPSETDLASLPRCDAPMAMHHLCEGDGECGTDIGSNNCDEGYDVYRRVPCVPVQPMPGSE
jgi:hypothetical protein